MSRVRNFVEPFALSYPFVPEMVELEPAMADVHGGVSIASANDADGLLVLMLAYVGQAKNDTVNLCVNDSKGPGTTIAAGEENDDTPVRLPAGLLQKGLNRIKFTIKRTSGNEESTKELVLYHRTSPPGDTPPVMNLSVSHTIIGPEEAKKFKVTAIYENAQWYDRIITFINGVHFEHLLIPGSASPLPPVPKSVVIDIPEDKLIEGGNDKTFEIKYRVVDYLTNPSGPPTWSDAVFVEVDLDKIALDPPTLVGATSPIDVLNYETGVKVRAEYKTATEKNMANLKIVGGMPGKPFEDMAFNANYRANFPLSVAFLLANQRETLKVSWLLISDGVQIGESPPLEVVIGTIAVDDPRLPTPNIAGELGQQLNVQDLPTDARVLSKKIPLMQQNYPVWVDYKGIDADGNNVTKEVSSGGRSELPDRISLLADVEWLETLKDGSPLEALCAVNLDGIKDKTKAVPLPVRTYTVSAFVEVQPEIIGVKDSIRENIAEGGTTADSAVFLNGTASAGQNIQIHDGASLIGPVIKVQLDGQWRQLIDGLMLKSYSFTAVAKYGSGLPSAPPRTLRVVDYVEEDFDQLANQKIQNRGEKIETPLLTIEQLGQGGNNATNGSVWSTSNPTPGKFDGKILVCSHMFHDGSAQISIKFKTTYKRLSFWMATSSAGAPLGTIVILNNGVRVGEIKTPGAAGQNVTFQDRSVASGFNELHLYSFSGTALSYQFDHIKLYK